MKQAVVFASSLLWFFGIVGASFAASPLSAYDHVLHEKKVFGPNKVDCSMCHTFSVDPVTHRAKLEDAEQASTFKGPLKDLCHQCHRTSEPKWKEAPQGCILCHRSLESMSQIMPTNHKGIAWKSNHSAEARTQGDRCLDCHVPSQCIKCHLRRNDIEMKNHSRNFRFTHSVIARAQPQRCDACHTKSYCINCHLGGR